MRFVLDLIYIFALLAVSPIGLYRLIWQNRYRKGWLDRLGKLQRKTPSKKCIWLHAVSLGEVNAARTVIQQLEQRFPDYEIVISTTTDTGYARATSLFAPRHYVFYFPFDFTLTMRRAFSNLQPSLCLLMELEVWPNFVYYAAKFSIPVVVINGRISDKSLRWYRNIKPFARRIFRNLTLVLAQTQQYADRFHQLGVPRDRIVVTGSLKYDTAQITDKVENADTLAQQLKLHSGRLWVAGGTGNDEEKIILDAYRQLKTNPEFQDLRLAVIPRKPERFEQVAAEIQTRSLPLIRYSHIKAGQPFPTDIDIYQAVILGDTMGDLRKFYSLATVVFVGRSLVPMGGSDMMEAAALGKCTLFGPHTFNFRQTVEALLAANGALLVKDKDHLIRTLTKCLTQPDFARQIARNGQQVIRQNQGATARTIEHIAALLSPS